MLNYAGRVDSLDGIMTTVYMPSSTTLVTAIFGDNCRERATDSPFSQHPSLCDDSDTEKISIQIPSKVLLALPMTME
jgi:hypothetical protein